MGSLVVAHGLSCSETYEILVLWPGIKPASPALQGEFLSTGPPGKSLVTSLFNEGYSQCKQQGEISVRHNSFSLTVVCLLLLQDLIYTCLINNQFSSVQSLSRVRLCDPMNRSMPDLPVHQQLLEFTETHVHLVSDAIQPAHPLSSPSPPAPNPSQHQSLFQNRASAYNFNVHLNTRENSMWICIAFSTWIQKTNSRNS